MRLPCAMISGLLFWCLTGVCAQAQEPLLNQAVQSNWVQFSIVAGRVTLESSRVGNLQTGSAAGSQRKEQLTIRNENGNDLTMTYQRSNAADDLAVDFSVGDRVHISRAVKDSKEAAKSMDFVQSPAEGIVLTLGAGDSQHIFRAAGLWQLLIVRPQECKEHLLPILEQLKPDWKLTETADKVEERLIQGMVRDVAAERARWTELVAQLGDDQFSRREAADRALRAASPSVLGYLRQLDLAAMDAEQQFRLHRIIDGLASQVNDDSPEQVAAMLTGDASVWLALLSRPDASTRQAAAQQLSALLGSPIPVDPAADPATQERQREQLRAKIEEK